MRRPLLALALLAAPALLAAQGASPAPAAGGLASLTPAQRIAAATLPLPAAMRATATVLGVDGAGKLATLRAGTGEMTCLAPDPRAERFHVACYHVSLEPFMARGRALRAEGVQGGQVDSVRFREVREGKLAMPKGPAALYSLTGGPDAYDAAANTHKARGLFVVYIPGATAESTGITAQPGRMPWVMFPGTPKAHIMFQPEM